MVSLSHCRFLVVAVSFLKALLVFTIYEVCSLAVRTLGANSLGGAPSGVDGLESRWAARGLR